MKELAASGDLDVLAHRAAGERPDRRDGAVDHQLGPGRSAHVAREDDVDPATEPIPDALGARATRPGELADEQVACVPLLVDAWRDHRRAEVREPTEDANVAEALREHLRDAPILDRQERAAFAEEGRALGPGDDRV